MRRRLPAAATEPGGFPRDLAGGPDPAVWQSTLEWRAAAETWSLEHLGNRTGWRDLLPNEVAYAVSSLGRAHARTGVGYRPPWERG